MYLIENDTNQLYKMKFLPNKKFAREHYLMKKNDEVIYVFDDL